mmetsp:Transcript_33972/g.88591  ORF Transcript_33972/g.88591 Transcript_33972/m.88591 type:complete len:233 (-) Transcript_33972:875-1573(-)
MESEQSNKNPIAGSHSAMTGCGGTERRCCWIYHWKCWTALVHCLSLENPQISWQTHSDCFRERHGGRLRVRWHRWTCCVFCGLFLTDCDGRGASNTAAGAAAAEAERCQPADQRETRRPRSQGETRAVNWRCTQEETQVEMSSQMRAACAGAILLHHIHPAWVCRRPLCHHACQARNPHESRSHPSVHHSSPQHGRHLSHGKTQHAQTSRRCRHVHHQWVHKSRKTRELVPQ